jgi:hypothetical protein
VPSFSPGVLSPRFPLKEYVALSGNNSTGNAGLKVYPWNPGFGTAEAEPPVLFGRRFVVSPSLSGRHLLLAGSSGGYSIETFNPLLSSPLSEGAVTKSVGAPSFSNTLFGADFHPNQDVFAVGGGATSAPPTAINWSESEIGTTYSTPLSGTFPTSGYTVENIRFHPTGDAVAVGEADVSPRLYVYAWSNGFGTKYANPATLPADGGQNVAFSYDGSYVTIPTLNSPRVATYPFSLSTGIGTRYANPGTAIGGQGIHSEFSPDGNYISIAHNSAPRVSTYPWNPGYGTRYANPGTAVPGDGRGVVFSNDNANIIIAHVNSPHISAYLWNPGYGTKYSNPTVLLAADASYVRTFLV